MVGIQTRVRFVEQPEPGLARHQASEGYPPALAGRKLADREPAQPLGETEPVKCHGYGRFGEPGCSHAEADVVLGRKVVVQPVAVPEKAHLAT